MRANSPKGQISQIWTPNPGKFWRAKLSLLITLASAAAMLYLHRWCVPTAVVVGASFYMYAARISPNGLLGWFLYIMLAIFFGFAWVIITVYFLLRYSWRGECRYWTTRDMALHLFDFEYYSRA